MNYHKHHLQLLIKSLLFIIFIRLTNSSNRDAAILIRVKNAQLQDPLRILDDWVGSSPNAPCSWTGVSCDSQNQNAVVAINLSGVNVSGDFPAGFCRISSLRNLDISVNNFGGRITSNSISLCSHLASLNISTNNFVGAMPEFTVPFLNLTVLDFSFNNFSGEIPASFVNSPNLQFLSLGSNLLNGSIPEFLSNLTELTQLILSVNLFRPSPLPANIGRLTKLENLMSTYTNLIGEIPESIGDLVSLKNLDVSQNNLAGKIPGTIGKLKNIEQIELFANQLSGELPDTFSNLTSLLRFDASENNLTGKIPESLAGLSLESLHLNDNFLEGEIPEVLALNPNLTELRLFNNRISGVLPEFLGMNSDLEEIDVSNNNLEGPLPQNLCYRKKLQYLVIFGNRFSGKIPESYGDCISLTYLRVHENELSGVVPDGLWGFSGLEYIEFADNKLEGSISPSISNAKTWNRELTKLKLNEFNVSNNRLRGKVPLGFEHRVFRSSLTGNPGLCSPDLNPLPPCSRAKPVSLVLVLVLSVLAFILVVSLVWLLIKAKFVILGRKSRKSWKIMAFQKVWFDEEQILASLKDENLIGSGGSGRVYRVEMRNGQTVAAKRLWEPKGLAEFEAGFSSEVETLGRIRHANIVRLLFSCSSERFKVLVYNYMENGSLGDVLYGDKGGFLLDWPKRFGIAMGAAQGLAYLHHDCVPAIVHRDVKCNNILLDEEFRPKVADFGLAKILKQDVKEGDHVMSRVAGSYGYIAPGKMRILFSLGHIALLIICLHNESHREKRCLQLRVVLLELITGKRPNDSSFGENKNIVKWVTEIALSSPEQGSGNATGSIDIDSLDQLLDPRMNKSTIRYHEVEKVLNVALSCTAELPVSRPSMRRVVELLKDHSTIRSK
ncbi:hypothetical protein DH2020_037526 [Rehmannia glutinosa]|uniref:Protein kinase domain-containing protein n=1 Tax=Rehmannia glutinosa TaxID=99300 RepID=A0ABR0V1C3_REHGL